MQPDTVLNFVALRQQGRGMNLPATAQYLKLPIPQTTLHKAASYSRTDERRLGSAPNDASDGRLSKHSVDLSRPRPDQAPTSQSDVFDTEAEAFDESLTSSLVDVALPRQSSRGCLPSRPAAQNKRAIAKRKLTKRTHHKLPPLQKTGVHPRESDDDSQTNSNSDGEPQQASHFGHSSDHESLNDLSRTLRSSRLPGSTPILAKTKVVPVQHSKEIVQSIGAAETRCEMMNANPLNDQDPPSIAIARETAIPDHKYEGLESPSTNWKYPFDLPVSEQNDLTRDHLGGRQYVRDGQASSDPYSAYSTSDYPAGQKNQFTEHNLNADRASAQSSHCGSEVQQFSKHSRGLDYTWDELSQMEYRRLKGESFDLTPGARCGPGEIVSTAKMVDTLRQIFYRQRHDRSGTESTAFFASLSIDQYEQCGDLIIDGFKDVLGKFKDARQQKRSITRKFEDQVQQRQYLVETKKCSIDKDLKSMKHQGSLLVPRSHS